MVAIAAHGGACCGAKHIHGFHVWNPDYDKRSALALSDCVENIAKGQLIEVILNDSQFRRGKHTVSMLKKLGFKRVSVFRNHVHNGSLCYCFHLFKGEDRYPLSEVDIADY